MGHYFKHVKLVECIEIDVPNSVTYLNQPPILSGIWKGVFVRTQTKKAHL